MNLAPLLAQATNLDMGAFQFRPQQGNTANQMVMFLIMAVALAVLGYVSYFFLKRRHNLKEMTRQREEARLRMLLMELNITAAERELAETLAESDRPLAVLRLLETRPAFEEAIEKFRESNPDHPALKRASQLRQRLEFGFRNTRNPFVDTRMLHAGTRMRCRIRLPKRDVSFLTTLIGTNESNFIIQPPTSKGKPVRLGKVKTLDFHVSRDNDAEYTFAAQVTGQLPGGNAAVVVAHTREISRMLFREATRYEADLPTQFFVVRNEMLGERSAAHFKAMDSQYSFEGTLKDISLGGVLAWSKGELERLHEGDMVIFRLPEARVRDDLVAEVMGLFPLEGRTQIHLQFQGLKEMNRLKISKFLGSLKPAPLPMGIGDAAGDASAGA